MIKSLISCMVKWLNAFPPKYRISKTTIPSMIVKRKPNPDFNQESILFGSHVLVYSGTRNEMDRRSIPSISLNESSDHG